MKKIIDFDKAATTAVNSEVLKTVLPYFTEKYYNPSSIYSGGKDCRNEIEETRKTVAFYINGNVENIYFTSSSSESNSLAIYSAYMNHLSMYALETEHIDVLEAIRQYGKGTIPVDVYGNADLKKIKELCYQDHNQLFIINMVNNEIGTLQDIRTISTIIHNTNNYLMVDATQAITHISIDVKEMGIDVLTFGAHKIGGLRGAAVLYSTLPLSTFIYGHQERGKRAGTENTPAIISLGKALLLNRNNDYIGTLRDYFEDCVLKIIDGTYINGNIEHRSNHISNICFQGCDAQTLQMLLDQKGIYVSIGSACNSKTIDPSHVLRAIGMTEPDIYCCLRFSFDENNIMEEVTYVVDVLKDRVEFLRSMNEI